MPSRQFHTKSRHGCANCKRRKIRCGEERPRCANCLRLGGECSFLESDAQGGLTVIRSYETSPVSGQSTPQRSSPMSYDLGRLAEDLDQFDEELIEQYSLLTSMTITDRADVVPTWQVTMPALALSAPYLRHGLLSLAAMHLHHASPLELRPLYSQLASLHQDKALSEYISELGLSTEQTCHALLAFSLLLPPLRYSFLITMNEPLDAMTFIDQTISIFEFLIGSTVISTRTDSWLRQGPMAPIMTICTLESIIPDLLDEPRHALTSLMDYISASEMIATFDHMVTYKRSVEMLSNAFPSTDDTNRQYLDATIGWPYFVGSEFIHLLKEHDSLALVILAFYGAALHGFDHVWWLEGWGSRLVEVVANVVVDPVHQSLLMWPSAMVSSSS